MATGQDKSSPQLEALESIRRLEGIVASAMDGIITINDAQEVVLFNPAAERMFGLPAAEALGAHVSRFIPERYRHAHSEHIHRFAETGVTNRQMGSLGAISGMRANGQEFPIEASISQVEIGGERLSTVILRDITERKAAEEALVDSRRRMEGIVQSAMDALITVDDQQKIVLFNPAAERMFGVPQDQAIGAPIERFIPHRFRATHAQHILRFKDTGVTNRTMGALGAVSGLRANGEEFPLEASISQVDIGGLTLATVILRDITERKANEEARQLLAREVDHRAKNVLAVVQAVVSLTRASTKEQFADAVRGRISALGRAHALLAQSRWQGADLSQVLAEETKPYERAGQVQIYGPSLFLNPNAVQPVSMLIHELATNAVKYGALSVDDGRVDVQFAVLANHELELSWTEWGGPAVREPDAEGFGTTLIREVVTRQLAGRLRMEWRATGLRLVAVWPASAYREATSPDAPPEGAAPELLEAHSGGQVLIVEDEALIGMELSQALVAFGGEVVGPVATVGEAMGLIASSPSLYAAVLDVNLAGVPVYPVADLLQERGVPIVFCTGYQHLAHPDRYGACPIVRKPVNTRLLAGELQRLRPAA